MKCQYCDRIGIHMCAGKLKAYHDSFTPEEREQQHAKRMDLLQKAIEAGKELKDKYGIELVCESTPKRLNQKTLDYLEAIDNDEVEMTTYESSEELFKALDI